MIGTMQSILKLEILSEAMVMYFDYFTIKPECVLFLCMYTRFLVEKMF